MEVQTDSERVRTRRKLVLEFLGSSVDLSTGAPDGRAATWRATAPTRAASARRRAGRGRRARRARCRASTSRRRATSRPPSPSRSRSTTSSTSATTRSASSATSASRPAASDAQNTFAIARRRARLRRPHLDRVERRPARVRLRLLRQLHRRLPDRRADVQERARHARGRDLGRVGPDRDRHDLPVLRRRLHADAPRPGRTRSSRSPRRWTSSVTDGHLCIKGRFGFQFVQERPRAE